MPDSESHPCDRCTHTDCHTLHGTSYLPAHCPISCNACSSLTKLDAEISLAHSHLVELSKQRRSLKIFINERHDPLTRLPAEIVSEIFKFYRGTISMNRFTKSWPVLILGQVCKRWRDVTLGTPQLWSEVKIVHSKGNHPEYVSIMTDWLKRSRSLPLSLEITCSYKTRENDSCSSLLDVLRSHSARWQNLSINCFCDSFSHSQLFNNLVEIPSNLEEISCSWGNDDDLEECHTDRRLLPKKLSITYTSTTLGLPFGWDRLTSLYISDSLYLQEFLNIIKHAPSLEDCDISSTLGPKDNMAFPNTPIISHSLTSLTIETPYGVTHNPLAYLTLPSLTTFDYADHCCAVNNGDSDILNAFIDRSSPPIEDFTFRIMVWPSSDLLTWYSDIPAITSLIFDTTYMSGVDFEDETRLANEFLILISDILNSATHPNLKRVTLCNTTTPQFWSTLCNILEDSCLRRDAETIPLNMLEPIPETPRRNFLESIQMCWIDYTDDMIPQVSMEPSVFSRLVEIEESGMEILLGMNRSVFSFSEALNTHP